MRYLQFLSERGLRRIGESFLRKKYHWILLNSIMHKYINMCTNLQVIIEEIYLKLRLDNLNNTQIAYTYCGLTLQGYNCTYDRSSFEWSVPIHGDTPSCSAYNPFYCNTKTECNSTSHPDQYCIVHLTDIHIHRNYTVGSESDCDLPCCCDISQVRLNSYSIDRQISCYSEVLQYARRFIMLGDR